MLAISRREWKWKWRTKQALEPAPKHVRRQALQAAGGGWAVRRELGARSSPGAFAHHSIAWTLGADKAGRRHHVAPRTARLGTGTLASRRPPDRTQSVPARTEEADWQECRTQDVLQSGLGAASA